MGSLMRNRFRLRVSFAVFIFSVLCLAAELVLLRTSAFSADEQPASTSTFTLPPTPWSTGVTPQPEEATPLNLSPLLFLPEAIEIIATPGDTCVDLSWRYMPEKVEESLATAPTTDGESVIEQDADLLSKPLVLEEDIAGFTIFYGQESSNYTNKIDVGPTAQYRVRNLANHITYFFTVRAYTRSKQFITYSNEVAVSPKPEEELLSDIESLLSGEIPATISTRLKQFGYDFFRGEVSTFAPVTDVPVGPDYIIGPGDNFTINLWGKAEATFQAKVSRDGEVTIPKVGSVKVWGLTFSQLNDVLSAGLSKYYPEFEMSISMGRLRTIRVFIVGEARHPGSYSLSSLSTMINALFACGGPTKNGSLRRVQLNRGGKTVKTLDIYDFLIRGDKSHDERLQTGDTLFIPVIGEVVGIAGNVKRPAIYEMKKEMNVGELIELSGGLTPAGYLQQVQVERFDAHEKKIVVDLNLSPSEQKGANPQLKTPLQDGDMVKIYPILLPIKEIVYLEGHVGRPDGYEFKPGMKLSNLITSFDDLLPEPWLDYGEITRLEEPDLHERIISFNLAEVLKRNPAHDVNLQSRDKVKVYSKLDFEDMCTATVEGEVRNPDKYLLFENMRVSDLIQKAGGLKDSAYLGKAELTRQIIKPDGVMTTRLEIDLKRAMDGDKGHNILLQKYDSFKVRVIPDWKVAEVVNIDGEVRFPGTYTMKKGECLSSLIKRAGGYTDEAYLRGAIFTRQSAQDRQQERLNELISRQEMEAQTTAALIMGGTLGKDDLAASQQTLATQQELLKKLKQAEITGRVVMKLTALDKFIGSEYDLRLEHGDELSIPPKPGTVEVLGEVYNPTSLLFREGKSVNYYLNQVGGTTKNAEEDDMYLVLADGTVISRSQTGIFGVLWDADNRRWISGGFMSVKLEPGDTVLVPKKLEKIQWLKETKDITQVLYQIAVGAGIILVAF